MAPKGKSSATSGTRKKHARKAAVANGPVDEPPVPKEKKPKGKDKKSKKEPRKKVYIPPVKPAPAQPDPLDTLGLAQKLPPELLVVLRLLSKKDTTTKRRALEDLQTAWIGRAKRDDEGEYLLYTLQEIIPVWLHHLPSLFLHPSRRIRLQAVALHASILHIPVLRSALFFQIREVVSSDQAESILGSWCLAVHDVDRQVSSYARESWVRYLSSPSGAAVEDKLLLDHTLFPRLWEFVQRTLLDPVGTYLYINPPQPAVPTSVPGSRKGSGRGTPVRRDKDDEPAGRSKADEEEEKEQDRKARLRVGAFGATEWVLNARFALPEVGSQAVVPSSEEDAERTSRDEFLAAFANPALWSSLYCGKNPPFVEAESFGYEQPVVRRSAWSLLQLLVQKCKGHLQPLLPVLSRAVLRSAWVELDPTVRAAMWQPLLMFLKEYPTSWSIEAEPEKEDEDEDDDDDEGEAQPKPEKPSTEPVPSQAYTEFLQFLATGCSGSPAQGYPTILIVLSTIPPRIIALSSSQPLEDLFTSFWSAVDARVLNSLDRVAASTAFLSSLLECLVFVARRVINSPLNDAASMIRGTSGEEAVDIDKAVTNFLQEQVKQVWDELSSGRLKVPGKSAGQELAKALSSLYKLRSDLFDVAWKVVVQAVQTSVMSQQESVPTFVPDVLQQLSVALEKGTAPGDAAHALVLSVVNSAMDKCTALLDTDEVDAARVASVVNILEAFGDLVFSDAEATKEIDDLVQRQTHKLLTSMPSLVFLYLQHRQDEETCSLVWHQILNVVAGSPDEIDTTLSALLDAAERQMLPEYLRPAGEELRETSGSLLSDALSSPPTAARVVLVRRLLSSYEHFISNSCRENLLRGLVDAFVLHLDSALRVAKTPLAVLATPLSLLRDLSERDDSGTLLDVVATALFPYVFLLAFLLPQVDSVADDQKTIANALWNKWFTHAGAEAKQTTLGVIKHLLRELVVDWVAIPTPEQILRAVSAPPFAANIDILSDIFPSQVDLAGMLDALPSTPLNPSLAVVDPLVPPPTQYHPSKFDAPDCDSQGFSTYARVVHGLLLHLTDDRQMAKENVWALRHSFALAIYAEELKHMPSIESPMFSKTVSRSVLQGILDRVQQLAAYLLSATEEQWHVDVTRAVLEQGAAERLDGSGRLVMDLISCAKRNDTVRESRVLHMVLRHVLSTATKADAEQWMLVARKLEKQAPHTSLAIVFSVARYAPEPTRLDRLRNELAAETLGVRAAKANTEGLWLLRMLAAAAPDPESDIAFLPQPRAVNLVKACQQWITADEDLEEDVQSEMTLVFVALVPILSNVPGGHWDLMFDVIENNLENSSLDDSSTYTTLARTLQLFLTVEDFAASNKMLRAAWEERKSAILVLIRDLVAVKLDEKSSTPLSTCRELALQIIQDLPTSLMTRDTLPKMAHLLLDGSVNVQRMAHQLLQEAAKKYTEELVIEAAVDTEGTMKPELPTELLDILQRNLNHEDTEEFGQEWFGYLLAWMVAFDLFIDASLKVKSGYIDQLRDLNLIGSRLLPTVFGLLDLYGGVAKAFKLEIWDIDEYYLDFYSPDTPISIRLLTAHLYYRALLLVPSLVRSWLVDCRDRQLSSAVASYTSRHFSPAIIRTELAHVKGPAGAELAGENVTIKVAPAVHEVTASYAVDEQRLELTVKLPADWPLHTIEIRDSRLVGVSEDRWRAWVLGVQQILTFRSGSIVDGLGFFLKNVSSHFEGIAECAICYSIVNATDGSLPRKPCKTCKNRFHAACLYKWFNTSHSSSCPLCRSEIMTAK